MPATTARTEFCLQEYRYATSEDAAIRTRRALAETVEVGTLFLTEAAASAEAARQQALFGVDRDLIVCSAPGVLDPAHDIGVTLTVTGLPGGARAMVIVGVVFIASDDRTELTLWG